MELKLGKLPAEHDRKGRTLKLSTIMKVIPPIPDAWDYDGKPCKVPTPMFANDRLGCCVIAGRGHQTMRFEYSEQCKLLPISEHEIIEEYFDETRGRDSGLVVLESLKEWRNRGWTAAGNKYDIHAFARVDFRSRDHFEIRAAIYLLTGIGIGVSLPQSAMTQFEAGKPWTVPSFWNFRGKKILGGHYIYLCGYDRQGVHAVTWGQKCLIAWPFLDKYCDEAWAIVDAKDKFCDGVIDVPKLEAYLSEVTK